MVNSKDLALHQDDTHVHTQILHGNRGTLKGFSIESIAGRRGLFLCLRCGTAGRSSGSNSAAAHIFHSLKERLALQGFARFHADGHRSIKLLLQVFLYRREMFLKDILAVCHQVDGQIILFPYPFRACQNTPCHGVTADKHLHQLVRFNLLKLMGRIDRLKPQPAQTVHFRNILLRLVQQPLRDVFIRTHQQGQGLLLRV